MQRTLIECGVRRVDDPKDSVTHKGPRLHPQVLMNRAERLKMERSAAEKEAVNARYRAWRAKNPHFGKFCFNIMFINISVYIKFGLGLTK